MKTIVSSSVRYCSRGNNARYCSRGIRLSRFDLGARTHSLFPVFSFSTSASPRTLVLAEHDHKSLNDTTLHTITAAKKLGGDVTVLVAGQNCQPIAEQVSKLDGVSRVVVSSHDAYSHFITENITNLMLELHKAQNFTHILSASSSIGKSVLPRVGVKLSVQPISDVISIQSTDTFVRPIYAGNAMLTLQSKDNVKVLTIRSTAFEKTAKKNQNAPIETFSVSNPEQGLSKWVNDEVRQTERPSLTSARVVVSGGRAMKSADNFKILETLADKLGGAVGASRAAVDAGYAPNDLQVGQTGKVVAPELYLAVGISGAIQHLAGMKDSKIIVAINKDADAPIFQVADYGLVGDLFNIIPQLNAKIK